MFGNSYFTRYTQVGIRRTFKIVCRHHSKLFDYSPVKHALQSCRVRVVIYDANVCVFVCVRVVVCVCVYGGGGGVVSKCIRRVVLVFFLCVQVSAGRRTEHNQIETVDRLFFTASQRVVRFLSAQKDCVHGRGEKKKVAIILRHGSLGLDGVSKTSYMCLLYEAGNRFEILKPNKQSDRRCFRRAFARR